MVLKFSFQSILVEGKSRCTHSSCFPFFFFVIFVAEKKYKCWLSEEGAIVKRKPFKLYNYSIKPVCLHQKCILS